MGCSKSGCRHPFTTLLLVVLFVLDVFTDIATGVELILNDYYIWYDHCARYPTLSCQEIVFSYQDAHVVTKP